MRCLVFILVLSLFLCKTDVQKDVNDCISLGHQAIDLAKKMRDQRDSIKAILSAFKYVDSCNRIHFGHDKKYLRINL